jgi:hypothetical protein
MAGNALTKGGFALGHITCGILGHPGLGAGQNGGCKGSGQTHLIFLSNQSLGL